VERLTAHRAFWSRSILRVPPDWPQAMFLCEGDGDHLPFTNSPVACSTKDCEFHGAAVFSP